LGAGQTRYVATAALVTDLAVHFLWGRESSLVWVTRLSTGRSVAGAAVAISDFCTGAVRWQGRTDGEGTAGVRVPGGALRVRRLPVESPVARARQVRAGLQLHGIDLEQGDRAV